MKIYRVYVYYWEYCHTMKCGSYTFLERFFSTKEKAEEWVAKIKHMKRDIECGYIYTEDYEDSKGLKSYEPIIKIMEVEFDNMERP